ncbi:MAG: Bug family tripartite tricarboxylate transporter substrate binding protein [Lautropia sp.]
MLIRSMSKSRSAARRSAVAALLSCIAVLPALAQSPAFPGKPIRLVVPFGAGGAVDIVARALGSEIGKLAGQPVIVENRTGAGGNIAGSFVAKSEPDGYTLLMASTGMAVNGSLYTNLDYNPDRDLLPIALVGSVAQLLLMHPSVPVANASQLAALAKEKPQSLNFAHGGAGTTEHLAAVLLLEKLGVKVQLVGYKGGAPAMTDLIGGHTQLFFTNQLNALPPLRAGTVKALAVASPQRSKQLPDIPTFAEVGLPDFSVEVWWGVMGPAGIPAPTVARLNELVNQAIATPEFAARLESVGARARAGSAAQFDAFFKEESARWGAIVRAGNIKPD